jgi:sugar/nucleoside kinase (ribokinase family)
LLLQTCGVDTELLQLDSSRPTNTVKLEISENGSSSFHRVIPEKLLELGTTPNLLARAEDVEILYFHSFTQGGEISGETLGAILKVSPPSFKVYDIDCGERQPTQRQVEEGLSVASAVYVRGSDLSFLSDLLGLPNLDPGLFASAVTERFGPSYCVVADPFAGALISSIAGEQVGLDLVRQETLDIRGWHEAYLAAFVYHVFQGSSLSQCCASAMRYGDLVAMTSGALEALPAEVVALVKGSD